MNKSDYALPIIIIVALAALVVTVVFINSKSPDFWDKMPFGKEAPITDSSESDVTVKEDEAEQNGRVDRITLNKNYVRTLEPDKADKVQFVTAEANSDYRFYIKTKISESPLSGSVMLSVYDDRGIKLEEFSFSPRYDNSPYYCDEFYFDMNFGKREKYILKLEGENSEGDYQISVLQLERDAGADAEHATSIEVGDEVTASLNSTLSDWYVCDIDQEGKYEITFHNINTGCRVGVSGTHDEKSLFYYSAGNEDGKKHSLSVYTPIKILIEIKPEKENANGNYILSINRATD